MTFTPNFTPKWRVFCTEAVSEKIPTTKLLKTDSTMKIEIFGEKSFFFRKNRHNRHFFRQTGRNFFIVGKLSFKLWSRFHTEATPERKLCIWMWELWRNDRFLAIFSYFHPSYLHTYDELEENFLHVCSQQLSCFAQKVSAKCMRVLAGLSVTNCKMRQKNRIIPS